ncbi:MAG: hypothetical protein ACI9L9_002549 [Marivirga sp.]|jgi:hypothetical protein
MLLQCPPKQTFIDEQFGYLDGEKMLFKIILSLSATIFYLAAS